MVRFSINYYKPKPIQLNCLEENYNPSNEEVEYNFNPFRIQKIQNYQPIYSHYFEMTGNNYNNISFHHKYFFHSLHSILDVSNNEIIEKPVFIKYSPLLDPLRYMNGKYNIEDSKIRELPKLNSTEESVYKKLLDTNNASYIDGFFSFLSSQLLNTHGFKNAVDYYGTFLALQDKFKMNITDDYDYLMESSFFNNNKNKLFEISKNTHYPFMNFNSRGNKMRLNICENENLKHNISVISMGCSNETTQSLETQDLEEIYKKNTSEKNDNDYSDSETTEYEYSSDEDVENIGENNSDSEDEEQEDKDSSDEEWEDVDEEEDNSTESSIEESIFAFIKDFPVQMICLEKCDGTLDELFDNQEIDDVHAASALIQVIMILITFQKVFSFTHNDLHTNNIMYTNTDIEYLYYKYENSYYKVPTYGKIFKIIDFGRSIYKFQGKLFCSDSFAPNGDGSTQYNFEPYYNPKKPTIEPNYSFDLCRLGCSIYDFIVDDEKDPKLDELQKTIIRWCKDDNNKNVLYKKNGEERYPGFSLYKMIARTVHKHTPQKQLKYPYFKQFEYKPKTNKTQIVDLIDIDKIPIYV